jgi:hypothetical protein
LAGELLLYYYLFAVLVKSETKEPNTLNKQSNSMKKVLLPFLLILSTITVIANPTQGNWRWRYDNGSETNASWLENENSAVTISGSQTIRLRTQLFSATGSSTSFWLQYSSSLNPGVWANITNTAGANAFELAGYTYNIMDNTPTTQQLNGCTDASSYSYQPGNVFVSTELATKSLNANTNSEFEWVITPTNNLQPNVTYTFRVANAVYQAALPTLVTTATLPVQLVNFTAKAENSSTKLQWTTASEFNNDFFQVERSADGNTWTTINTVKSIGTSTNAHTYTSYDKSPSQATNYYRLSQHDFDGRVKTSGVVAIKFRTVMVSSVTVYPNPVVNKIQFRLENVSENKFTATLVSLDGRLVHREDMRTTSNTNIFALALAKKLAPGTYVLTISGDNFSANDRVIVQ